MGTLNECFAKYPWLHSFCAQVDRSSKLADLDQILLDHKKNLGDTEVAGMDSYCQDLLLQILIECATKYLKKSVDDFTQVTLLLDLLYKVKSTNLCTLNDCNMLTLNFYESSGKLEYLNKAVESQKKIITLSTKEPDLRVRKQNMSNLLITRYAKLRNEDDLNDAIDYLKEYENCNNASILGSLGNAYESKYNYLQELAEYNYLKELADLEKAIKYYEAALRYCSAGNNRFILCNNLGNALKSRYECNPFTKRDINNAIFYYKEAISHASDGDLHKIYSNLGWCFSVLNTFSKAIDFLKKALEFDPPLLSKLPILRNLIDCEFKQGHWEQVYSFYPQLVEVSVSLLKEQSCRKDKEAFLRDTQGVAVKAAYAQIQMGNLGEAMEILEQGVARLLSAELGSPFETDINVVKQISNKKILIYIFTTEKGGYALNIFKGEIQKTDLPKLTECILNDEMVQYFGAYRRYRSQKTDKTTWREAIDTITKFLYQVVMQPVVANLPKFTAITLIPIGFLNLLPLHAASIVDEYQKRYYILDDYTISYAPNALSLKIACERAKLPPNTLLAINEPKPVAYGKLPNADTEVKTIQEYFEQSCVLSHEQATVEAVKDELKKYSVLHFVCHGGDFRYPSEISLIMADNKKLTVQDFFSMRLNTRLVSLSACESGMITRKLPEEVVSLPTSLLQAGVAGIVASLWGVEDKSTMLLMSNFYAYWLEKYPDNPAEALRLAQISVRDSHDSGCYYGHPYYWAAFTYTGA